MLAQHSWIGSSGNPGVSEFIDFRMGPGDPAPSYSAIGSLVSEAAIGSVLSADPGHPAFADLAAALTDGVGDVVTIRAGPLNGGSTGSFVDEALLFPTGDVPGLMPDAAGYAITRIEMEVHHISLTSPGADLNGDGVWTDFSFDVTIRIYGRPNG
ncbi:MAG: hypothetical protein QNJ98_14515 [Planctomycetota bacterium]|nr:hypothetical protein [Planctomycetota bacterium]